MARPTTGNLTYEILRVFHGQRLYAPRHIWLNHYCQLEQSRNGKRYSEQHLPLIRDFPGQWMTMRTIVRANKGPRLVHRRSDGHHGRQSRRRLGPVRPEGQFASNAKQNHQVDRPVLYIPVTHRTPALRKYAYNDVACVTQRRLEAAAEVPLARKRHAWSAKFTAAAVSCLRAHSELCGLETDNRVQRPNYQIMLASKNQVFTQMGFGTRKGSPNRSPARFSVAQRPWTLSIEERLVDSPLYAAINLHGFRICVSLSPRRPTPGPTSPS